MALSDEFVSGIYNTGTVTIAGDRITATGVGTLWSMQVEQGDWLLINGQVGLVNTISDDTHLLLQSQWQGTLPSASAYVIIKMSWLRYEPALTQAKLRELLAALDEQGTFIFTDVAPPDPALGQDGQWALKADVTPWQVWYKDGGVWVQQKSPGAVWRGTWSASTAYMQSDVVERNGSSYISKTANTNKPPESNPTDWDLMAAGGAVSPSDVREKLTASRTYFCRTDGNDANNGLANTAGGAFATLQKGINTIWNRLDLNGFNVTIQVGDGTYTSGITVIGPHVGSGLVTIIGNATTPANVVISTTGADAVRVAEGAQILLDAVKLQTTTTGTCVLATLGGEIILDRIVFGPALGGIHMEASDHGRILMSGVNYTIAGGAIAHYHCINNGRVLHNSGTVTLTGTPAFSAYFIGGSLAGSVQIVGVTYSGAATGQRFLIHSNAAVSTGGAGFNYFPGNSPGQLYGGGIYDDNEDFIAPLTSSPAVGSFTGTFAAASCAVQYKTKGKYTTFTATFTVTSKGSVTNQFYFGAPTVGFTSAANFAFPVVIVATNQPVGGGFIPPGGNNIFVNLVAPIADGDVYVTSGTYWVN